MSAISKLTILLLTLLLATLVSVAKNSNVIQISLGSQNFGVIIHNPSVYYYLTDEGVRSVKEGVEAVGIREMAYIPEGQEIRIKLGEHRLLPRNTLILLDNDKVPDLNDDTQVVIKGNESGMAEIVGNNTLTTERIYVFLKTGSGGDFQIDIEGVIPPEQADSDNLPAHSNISIPKNLTPEQQASARKPSNTTPIPVSTTEVSMIPATTTITTRPAPGFESVLAVAGLMLAYVFRVRK